MVQKQSDKFTIDFVNTSGVSRTGNIYYNGTTHNSNLSAPLLIKHNNLAGLNLGDYQHLSTTQLSALHPIETSTTIGALIGGSASGIPNDSDYIATSLTSGGILQKLTISAFKTFISNVFSYKSLIFSINGSGFPVVNGVVTPYIILRNDYTITGWDLLCSNSDTLTVDILYHATFSSTPVSITGTGIKPNTSSTASASGTNMSNWSSVNLSKNGVITVSISGTPTAATWITLKLRV